MNFPLKLNYTPAYLYIIIDAMRRFKVVLYAKYELIFTDLRLIRQKSDSLRMFYIKSTSRYTYIMRKNLYSFYSRVGILSSFNDRFINTRAE